MNQAERCHQVAGCPGLYIDAFKAFRSKTTDPSCAFILTHYHGDHYNGLPRDGAYVGPAKIHCTAVTAALLRSVHGVSSELIVEHSYGEKWVYRCCSANGSSKEDEQLPGMEEDADITFYDANHCPGAAIVLIQLPDGKTHLHTGDMRYHTKMQEYLLLKQAAEERCIDLLYLDTTYSHPKHDFVPQTVAVESIATQVEQLFSERDVSTLVLLSCYSIGKEKVLWECSKRTNRRIYVNERKHKMLQCIQGHKRVEESSSIIDRCTRYENESEIHVVPMGLCGEMWPYFQPNYNECAKYTEKLEGTKYDRVAAFIPTGWANATNWNKKNAVSKRRINLDKIQKREGDKKTNRHIDVEIRLISYSEHSTFPELCSFVEYLKPRKVIPTVYSDEKDYVAIEGRFRDMIDSKRAKHMFVNSIKASSSSPSPCSVSGKKRAPEQKETGGSKMSKLEAYLRSVKQKDDDVPGSGIVVIDCCDDDEDNNAINEDMNAMKQKKDSPCDDNKLAILVSMGFGTQASRAALAENKGNVDEAIESLLSSTTEASSSLTTESAETPESSSSSTAKRANTKKSSGASIMQFFSPKRQSSL